MKPQIIQRRKPSNDDDLPVDTEKLFTKKAKLEYPWLVYCGLCANTIAWARRHTAYAICADCSEKLTDRVGN